MRIIQTVTAAAVFVCGTALPALAQSSRGADWRLVVGVTRQGGVFGDDAPRSSSRWGMTIGAQARRHPDRRTGLVLDVAFQPFATRNPHFDERLRVLTVQIAPEIGRTFYVRPGGGLALHFWSGSQAEAGFKLGPSLGVAVGRHITIGSRVRMSPEISARSSLEYGAAGWTLAAQVPVSWSSDR
jgi:hypothetical protein